jgi:hypothetical protein
MERRGGGGVFALEARDDDPRAPPPLRERL